MTDKTAEETSKQEDESMNHSAQSLVGHLIELRDRLLKAILSVLFIFLILYPFANEIYFFFSQPLNQLLPEGNTMIATDVASTFIAPFKLCLVLALFGAIPMILYQLWSFVAPGLYKNEKMLVIPLMLSSVFLFYAGVAFAYFVVFKLVFNFFISIAPEGIAFMTDISSYLDFILKMFFAFGLAFEIPVATVLMVLTGIATVESLQEKRPYIVVGCFVVAMLLTPPDILSQILLAIPMWLLFESGIFFSWLMVKLRKETKENIEGDKD